MESRDWPSLPISRFAGAAEQPRSPAPTVVSWPPPPARGSAPPPPPPLPTRPVAPSLHELLDEDILEELPAGQGATPSRRP